MTAFEVGQSDTPVYRDGLTTDLSYAFIACKKSDEYNGVVYGRGSVLKFYPSAQFWGITQGILNQLHIGCLYNRPNYQGVHGVGPAKIPALLERLRTQRGVTAVSDKDFAKLGNYPSTEVQTRSREYHPATHGVPARGSLRAAFHG